jgi:hypothetical protein
VLEFGKCTLRTDLPDSRYRMIDNGDTLQLVKCVGKRDGAHEKQMEMVPHSFRFGALTSCFSPLFIQSPKSVYKFSDVDPEHQI